MLREYRDSRAIHVSTLKRWKAALRATHGNPIIEVLATMPAVEVRRENVERAVAMARQALADTRRRLSLAA